MSARKLESILVRVYGEWTPACREAARAIAAELAALDAKPAKSRKAKAAK